MKEGKEGEREKKGGRKAQGKAINASDKDFLQMYSTDQMQGTCMRQMHLPSRVNAFVSLF